jgi:hypothetical protein
MPVWMRAALAVSPLSGTSSAATRPARGCFGAPPRPASATSSTIEFQSPHASHRPAQRADTAPQLWHT